MPDRGTGTDSRLESGQWASGTASAFLGATVASPVGVVATTGLEMWASAIGESGFASTSVGIAVAPASETPSASAGVPSATTLKETSGPNSVQGSVAVLTRGSEASLAGASAQ